jgi:uncharacterized membrane protein YccC
MAETFAMQADARRAEDPESQLGPLPDVVRRQCARRHDRPDSLQAALYSHRKKPFPGTNSIPWIFATKTTASGLIALLVAFTFNLDEPYWALLTVFIVSQPLQSGQVLAKSLYRIIGTVIGAAVALLFAALFAQERVLFLGALAVWIGLCAFSSQYARNFAAYSFVLSGYTVAIVGIPGTLDAGNAFYIATGRVTEVCLGIIVAATVNHIILPSSLVPSLWQGVVDAHAGLADYAVALFGAGDTAPLRAKLLGQAIEIENLRASAIFEDREIRARSNALRLLDLALINSVGTAQLLRRTLDALGQAAASMEAGIDEAIAEAIAAIKRWRVAAIDVAGLGRGLVQARGAPAPRPTAVLRSVVARRGGDRADSGRRQAARVLRCFDGLCRVLRSRCFGRETGTPLDRLRSLQRPGGSALDRAARRPCGLRRQQLLDPYQLGARIDGGSPRRRGDGAAGDDGALRAGCTRRHPAFIIVEVLLPLADGFGMFAVAVAPMLFLCAFLMAHKKTMLIGYMSALLFASAGQFLDQMVYDPVGMLNTCIAAVVSAATAMVLWAIIAPATPEAARRRFVRAARRALAGIAARRRRIGLAEFQTAMTEALGQLRGQLRPDQPDDIAAYEAAIALFGAGRELIRVREDRASSATAALVLDIAELAGSQGAQWLDRARRTAQDAAARCLAELRKDAVGAKQAQSAGRKIVAFAAIRDELERGGELLSGERRKGAQSDAA